MLIGLPDLRLLLRLDLSPSGTEDPVSQPPYKGLAYKELLPTQTTGEKLHSATVKARDPTPLVDYSRLISHNNLLWTIGSAISSLKAKLRHNITKDITPAILNQAQETIIRDVQSAMADLELSSK